jgi:hypothetical protein
MASDNTAAIVSAICNIKDRQLHNLQKKMRRIEKNMESANYKQFVDSDDDHNTLLRAVRAALPIAKLCLERVQFTIMYSKSPFMN